MGQRRCKIALYSHDTMGLGHMRRNLLVAEALRAGLADASILMLFGAREAAAFHLPAGVEALTLPALHKDAAGRYRARNLPLSIRSLVDLRSRTLRAALESFDPDLLIVDKVARGAMGELEPALDRLRARGRCRVVLGLRDLLDDPETVRAEFERDATEAAIEAYYDAVWVYGDPRICNPVMEYGLSGAVAERLRFTGYLDPRHAARAAAPTQPIPERPYALCMVGGGQDGAQLAAAFAEAPLPDGMDAVLVTGPMMPDAAARDLAGAVPHGRLRVIRFLPDPSALIRGAACVVTMGGYNSVTDVLSFQKRALVAPRVIPRTEQLLRARRMEALGLLDVVTPQNLTSASVGEWLAQDHRLPTPVREVLDFDGFARVPALAGRLLRAAPLSRRTRRTGVEVTSVAV